MCNDANRSETRKAEHEPLGFTPWRSLQAWAGAVQRSGDNTGLTAVVGGAP